MIGVEPRRGACPSGNAAEPRRRGRVDEGLLRLLPQQRDPRRSQHEQIGVAVVVGITGDDASAALAIDASSGVELKRPASFR